jgi:flagellar hook-associated protein 2
MSITFGGLATGLDTNTLIDELMELERKPITRLENEKNYLDSRLSAFTKLDEKLQDLMAKMEDLDTSKEVRSYSTQAASEEFFSATATGSAVPGSYQIEVKNLARLQKDASQGFASKSEAGFGTGTITINGTDIAYDGDSLEGIMEKINDANTGDTPTGVSASIINDGVTGYRLVLTGDDSATTFTVSVSETVAGTYAAPLFTNTQTAQQATIVVDGIEIKSNNNTFSEAIPGVEIDLLKANENGVTTNLEVGIDEEGVKTKIEAFVSSYNDVISFINDQADASWGRDPALRSAKRRLQNLLVTSVGGTGSFSTLSQLGLESQRDGTLTLDSTTLSDAIQNDLDGIGKLLAGEEGVDGIATRYVDYLDGITDSIDGLLANRKKSTESNTRRIDLSIERIESRLEKREATLRAQFEALETLVSTMNTQSSFLAQQMSNLSSAT